MVKKVLSLTLALALLAGLAAVTAHAEAMPAIAKENIKIGAVMIGPKDDGYSGAHYRGLMEMQQELGLNDDQILFAFTVPENNSESAFRELVAKGCNFIIGNSWGYKDFMMELADEHPDIVFSHCSGNLNNGINMNNYFGRIYQARYLAGIAAGLKTTSNKIGYVAAWPDNAEINGGINAFALGIQSVNPDAEVYVKYVYSWFDPTVEKQTAEALLALDCDVIAQHCDTAMPQIAAEEAGKFGCGYNMDMTLSAPKAHLTAPIWNWGVIYIDQIKALMEGTWQPTNYFWGLKEGLVDLSPLSENVAEGTAEKIEAARQKMMSGEWDVFTGPLVSNTGEEVLAEGKALTDAEITGELMMGLLIKGVVVK